MSRIHYPYLSSANTFTNNPLVVRIEELPAEQKMARLRMVGSFATFGCSGSYPSLNYPGIIRLMSIDRTNGYEHSYWSLAIQSSESTPDSLLVHSTRLRLWSCFEAKGA